MLFTRRPEIVLRQGGNVRGTNSLDILADSRMRSVFASRGSASSSPPGTTLSSLAVLHP